MMDEAQLVGTKAVGAKGTKDLQLKRDHPCLAITKKKSAVEAILLK